MATGDFFNEICNSKDKLSFEHKWLINEMIKEFANVKHLCSNSVQAPEMLPSIVTKLYWYHGLEQRMKVSCGSGISLSPKYFRL